MKSLSTFIWAMFAFSSLGCGARTEFGQVVVDDSTPTGPTSVPPPTRDQCPSAILAGAPKAMTGNCSTRDGRTRAAAPHAPLLRWTTQVPVAPGTGDSLLLTGLVTDAMGNTFVSSSEGYGDMPAFRKFDSKGALSWAVNFAQDPYEAGPGSTPFLTANDSLLLFGGPPVAVSVVDPMSGALSPVGAFGFEHRNVLDPAIGRDGSLYFVHEIAGNAGYLAVSRASTDGTITWTSEALAAPDGEAVSEVALGDDDRVFVAISSGHEFQGFTNVHAFDSATGDALWTRSLDGAQTSDLRVRPDGSVVVSHSGPYAGVSILAPTGQLLQEGLPRTYPLAVAANGGLLLSDGPGRNTLLASDANGKVLWETEAVDVADATITNDGIVIAAESSPSLITAIDFSSGNVVWTIPAPSADSCLLATTLTSDGTVIGVQCDGTLFGASD